MKRALWALGLMLPLLAPLPLAAAEPSPVPEPPGLWSGPMVSDTPATLQGAQVIDVPALESLLASQPLLLDVGPADRKPETLPAGSVWKPVHHSIPGAVWLPGAGRFDLPIEHSEALLRRVSELSAGRKDAPVVVFCKPRCWGSWNAAKRLVQAGYNRVYWFPAGVHGWQERNDTRAIPAEPGWSTTP